MRRKEGNLLTCFRPNGSAQEGDAALICIADALPAKASSTSLEGTEVDLERKKISSSHRLSHVLKAFLFGASLHSHMISEEEYWIFEDYKICVRLLSDKNGGKFATESSGLYLSIKL